MVTIGISEFRANMNQFLQKVQNGEIISLTSRGEEVARLVPPNFAQQSARETLEELKKTAVIHDILSPIVDEWSANQ